MKLCQKCVDSITLDLLQADSEKDKIILPSYQVTAYVPRPTMGSLIRRLFDLVPEADCEFPMHQAYNQILKESLANAERSMKLAEKMSRLADMIVKAGESSKGIQLEAGYINLGPADGPRPDPPRPKPYGKGNAIDGPQEKKPDPK